MSAWKMRSAVRRAAVFASVFVGAMACSGGGGSDAISAPAAVATVSVTLAQPRVVVGATTTAAAALSDAAGAALIGRSVQWTSANTAVATVSAAGLLSAVAPGTAAITATSEGKTGSAQLTVDPPPVATVTVTLTQSTVVVGGTTTASVVLRDANGAALTNRTVVWASTNPSVASVTDGGVVSTVAVGTVSISATSEGKSGTATLTVIPPPVASISVALAQSVLAVNASTNATAVLRDAGGNLLTDRAVTWSSSNTSVAVVSANGLVSAVAAGGATISASSEGRTGSANLTVQLPPVATVTISGALRVKVGDTYTYTATLRLGDGTIVFRPITWSITDVAQASITQSGVLTPLQSGAFTIRLVIDGVAWTATYAAYDWDAFTSGGSQFLVLEADNTITNRSGTVDYSELVVSCGSGFFFVWVRTPHVITSSGQVALSFDGAPAFSQTWNELSPSFNTLWKPGSNLAIKSFSLDIAAVRVFGFAFTEFLGSAKAMLFRVGGLGPRLTPLFTACPGSAIAAGSGVSTETAAGYFAAQRAALGAHRERRMSSASTADGAAREQYGPMAASPSGLADILGGMMGTRVIHTQSARRER